jgi:hypothetical protein
MLYVGDLSYANDYPFHDNNRWDTWGRFIERVAAYQPWIWTAGNHEIDFAPELVCLQYLSTILASVLCWTFLVFGFFFFVSFLFVVFMYLFYRKMQTNALRGLFKESKGVTFCIDYLYTLVLW